jgi:hypothetical protein
MCAYLDPPSIANTAPSVITGGGIDTDALWAHIVGTDVPYYQIAIGRINQNIVLCVIQVSPSLAARISPFIRCYHWHFNIFQAKYMRRRRLFHRSFVHPCYIVSFMNGSALVHALKEEMILFK